MHRTSCWIAGMLWLGLASGAMAATPEKPECVGDDDYSTLDVLDPQASPAAKQTAVDAVVRLSAQPGCVYERYLLGTLHRYGPTLSGNPLPKDSAKAVELLEQYASQGHPQGYSDLAELALADADARSAMQWTQVYLFLVARDGDTEFEEFDRSGYNADLLLRAQKAWQKARLGGPRNIEALLNAYLQPRKAQLLEGMAARKPDLVATSETGGLSPAGELRIRRAPKRSIRVDMRIKPGYAIFLMEVQPSGKVTRVVAESFAPTPDHARALRPFVEGFEYYPFEGTEPQQARVPVQYGYTGAYAPSLKR